MEHALATRTINYVTKSGDDMKLTPDIVRRYLARGKAELLSDQEIVFFLHTCKAKKLNPFIGDAYIIKYGSDPASIITSRSYYQQLAMDHPRCKGWTSGIIVQSEDFVITEREGTLIYPGDDLIGGWARTWVEGWAEPKYWTVPLEMYIKRKRDGNPTQFWGPKKQPHMIAKIALVQLLREVYDNSSGQVLSPEEIDLNAPGPQITIPPERMAQPFSDASQQDDDGPDEWTLLLHQLKQSYGYTDKVRVDQFIKATSLNFATAEAEILSDALNNLEKFYQGLLRYDSQQQGAAVYPEPAASEPLKLWYDPSEWKGARKNPFIGWVMDNMELMGDIPADAQCDYQGARMGILDAIKAKWRQVNPNTTWPTARPSTGLEENAKLKKEWPDEWEKARGLLKMGGQKPLSEEGADIWNRKISELVDQRLS